jgi:hypothetical protein
VNGIAPGVSLVALKISQWCGSDFDSEIMAAFIWAAEQGIDVVSISFGGYLDRSDPFQDAAYKLCESVLDYVTTFGTTIVSSAGNEHTQIGKGGKVMSHGILSTPPGGDDFFGLYEVPGGIKASSTSRRRTSSSTRRRPPARRRAARPTRICGAS